MATPVLAALGGRLAAGSVAACALVVLGLIEPAAAAIPAADPSVVAVAGKGASTTASAPREIVVCAPGYPGSTQEAQPTMDAFAKAAEAAGKLPAGSLKAIYFETEPAGLAELAAPAAAWALVPFPFLVQHREDAKLTPILQVADSSGATEVWSLAVKKGTLALGASLEGWEITGRAGYAPRFVTGPALAGWGKSGAAGAKVTFSPSALSALRRAAKGDKVAVLLDEEQAAALATLPFAADIEIVYKSRPLPASLVCEVAKRATAAESKALTQGLMSLQDAPGGGALLDTMRMRRFEALDTAGLDAAMRMGASAAAAPAAGAGKP